MRKDALAPGDSTVVELSFNTHSYKSMVNKNATIFTNDLSNSQAKIYVMATVDSVLNPNLPIAWKPSKIRFTQKEKNLEVTVTNKDSIELVLNPPGDKDNDLSMDIGKNEIKPGETAKIKFKWNGGFQKENYSRSLTFSAGDSASSTIFTIPFVVEGTDPTPEPVAPKKPIVPTTGAQTTTTGPATGKIVTPPNPQSLPKTPPPKTVPLPPPKKDSLSSGTGK